MDHTETKYIMVPKCSRMVPEQIKICIICGLLKIQIQISCLQDQIWSMTITGLDQIIGWKMDLTFAFEIYHS